MLWAMKLSVSRVAEGAHTATGNQPDPVPPPDPGEPYPLPDPGEPYPVPDPGVPYPAPDPR